MRPLYLFILVGIPGSGKSFYVNNQLSKDYPFLDWNRTVVASTDNYVERVAKSRGKTYSEVFNEVMPRAVQHMTKTVLKAIKDEHDIVWDQTSTTIESRRKKLRMVPDNYRKIAVVFPTPDSEEHQRRLANRPGKVIPKSVIDQMQASMVTPTTAEGFDEVRFAF